MSRIFMPPLGMGVVMLLLMLPTAKAFEVSYASILWTTLGVVGFLTILRFNYVRTLPAKGHRPQRNS